MKKIILKCLIMAFIISVGGNFVAMAATLSYTPVTPCKIVDTRNTSAGMIGVGTRRNFYVFGDDSTIDAQGGNPAGCPQPSGAPSGGPLAAHINMVAVNPTGQGNLKAFPRGVGATTGLSVNYNAIGTNLANAGTVKTTAGAGTDITVASEHSSAHVTIQVLGYYYPINFAPVPKTGQNDSPDGVGVPWPDPRFTDNGDGTVTDNLTGLIWLKDANCGKPLDDLEHGQCGLTDGSRPGDWRLPNIRELSSLIDHGQVPTRMSGCTEKLPPGHPFTNVAQKFHGYISSTVESCGVGDDPYDPCYMPIHSTVKFWVEDCDYDAGISVATWPVRGGYY